MALITLLTFIVSLAFIWSLSRATTGTRILVRDRLRDFSGTRGMVVTTDKPERRIRKRGAHWLSTLETVLRQGEVDVPAREFAVRWGLLTTCGAIVGFLVLSWPGVVVAAGASWFGTFLYLQARGKQRTRRFNEGLHEVLTILSNSLRAGHSFVQSMHIVCQDMQGPIREEFERITAEMQVGVGLEEALVRANERIHSDDFDLVVTAITIQRQVGGNLAEILEKISETIRERVRLKREVKALTAQGRMSAGIFMFLPTGVGLILYLMNPVYLGILFTSSAGHVMLVLAVVGQAVGFVFIRRIIRIDL